eukprot:GHVU01118692.1.p2 GENE.GHVU01118692.1~~GHVU01118692.1.p2  ORF type:complete len:118 (-),score=15.60 GHVU01118692.1:44-397(-)
MLGCACRMCCVVRCCVVRCCVVLCCSTHSLTPPPPPLVSLSGLLGNLLTDAASATKYWYFVRLMGREKSHVVLEAALQTHPNVTVVSEQYAAEDKTLDHVVQVCMCVCAYVCVYVRA